jgi:hypothetical protein
MFSTGWMSAAWLRAAEGWCAERGLTVQRWRLDRTFMAGGVWYSVVQRGEGWEVQPVA